MNIGIKIVERKPIVEGSPRLICGNSGDTITFTFDSEWSNYTAKVARFVYVKNGVVESQEVLFNGNVAEIPVLSNITEVFIGVYTGDLRTTTPVTIPCDFSILCKGGEPVDPTPDIYAQILDALNAKLILEGNASSATKLETPRTIQVDLENSNGVSFDGTTDVNPGVTGVLPKEHGGTGTPTPELIFAPHAVKRVNGSAVAVNDSSNSPLANLKLYGKTEQDGTPTPTEPKELKSVGDSGSFNVSLIGGNYFDKSKVYTNYVTETKTGFSFTNNSLSGTPVIVGVLKNLAPGLKAGDTVTFYTDTVNSVIPAGSVHLTGSSFNWHSGVFHTITENDLNGDLYAYGVSKELCEYNNFRITRIKDAPYEPYTEQTLTITDTLRGVGDIADVKDFARGMTTRRINEVTLDGSEDENWQEYSHTDEGVSFYIQPQDSMLGFQTSVCDKYSNVNYAWRNECKGQFGIFSDHFSLGGKYFRPPNASVTTLAQWKAWLSENPIKLVYRLATPIETPISETELNAYRQLHTNKPNTTIVSEADLEVDYYTDTLSGETLGNLHSSLYSEIETLKQAIVSLGGEV